jgi:hypothetical protein
MVLSLITYGVSVKEEDRSSQDRPEHSVVENSGSIDTHEVEGHGSNKTQDQSKAGDSRIDVDPLVSAQGTCGGVRNIALQT